MKSQNLNLNKNRPLTARGRNGTFVPHQISIYTWSFGVAVGVKSRRTGRSLPIYFELSSEDALRLSNSLIKAVQVIKNHREEVKIG